MNPWEACRECAGKQGRSVTWDDDLGIRHEDWVTCPECKGSGLRPNIKRPLGCECLDLPVPERRSHWSVVQRLCNYSAFNGYRRQASAYSCVECDRCRSVWRTKARYVAVLPDSA